jgi:hypothetical protein
MSEIVSTSSDSQKPALPTSVTRTVVPMAAGWIVTLLVRRFGVTIDNDVVASLLTAVFGARPHYPEIVAGR